jgi:hypothetical protein
MIRMIKPALLIDSNDVPGPPYTMWQTVSAPLGTDVTSFYASGSFRKIDPHKDVLTIYGTILD